MDLFRCKWFKILALRLLKAPKEKSYLAGEKATYYFHAGSKTGFVLGAKYVKVFNKRLTTLYNCIYKLNQTRRNYAVNLYRF